MLFNFLFALSGAVLCAGTFIPSNATDSVNASIPIYTDPVLRAVAASPPSSASFAKAVFTNGIRSLPDASFNFTEMAGTTPGKLTVLKIDFAFPTNLTSTNNIFAYHVHESPIAADDNTCHSAGGHFDPFKVNGTEGLVNKSISAGRYNPTQTNLSTFQLGDLTGKWGALTTIDGSIAPRTIFEHYLRLTGNFSIVGRSVVVHDAPTDTRIACGNITAAAASEPSSASSTSASAASSAASSSASESGSRAKDSAGLRDAAVVRAQSLALLVAAMAAASLSL